MKRLLLVTTIAITSITSGFTIASPAHAWFFDDLRKIINDRTQVVIKDSVDGVYTNAGTQIKNKINCVVGGNCPAQQPVTPEVARQRMIQQFLKTKQCLGCDLSGLNFKGVDLSKAQLDGSNLSGSDFSGANLIGASLKRSNLKDADLSQSQLSGANLKKADLSGADLHFADLSRADLSGAILTGVNLGTATLTGTSFRGATMPDAQEQTAAIAK